MVVGRTRVCVNTQSIQSIDILQYCDIDVCVCVRVYQRVHLCENINAVLTRL